MLRNIEAFQLMFAGYPQRHERADQLEQHEGYPSRPHQGNGDAVELDQQLLRMTLDQTGGPADRRGGEYPGEQGPD